MRNIKREQNLIGDEHWPCMSMVTVAASSTAASIPPHATQVQVEEIIQSWHDIAILRVTPNIDAYFGFIIGDRSQYLNTPIQTLNGEFGVHIGDSDVTFFVFAKDMNSRLALELVEVTNITDPQYEKLPLY